MMRNLMQNAVKQIYLQVFCISSGDLDPDGEENVELKKPDYHTFKVFDAEKARNIAQGWNCEVLHEENGLKVIVSNGYKLGLTTDQFGMVDTASMEIQNQVNNNQ
jgi:N-formylglutamate amidohydrolase